MQDCVRVARLHFPIIVAPFWICTHNEQPSVAAMCVPKPRLSHDAVIRVYDADGNVIEAHRRADDVPHLTASAS